MIVYTLVWLYDDHTPQPLEQMYEQTQDVRPLLVKVRPTTHKELKVYALENDLSLSELVRAALIEYLAKRGESERVSLTVQL